MDNTLMMELINSKEPLEPETLYQLFPESSPLEIQLIQVIKVIKDTTFIHEDMDVFENAVYVINGINPDVNKTEGVKPEWVWYAIDFINKIKNVPFSDEVKEYVKWNFKDAGFKFFPDDISDEEDELLKTLIERTHDDKPLEEDFIGIQTLKYLRILEYLKEMHK